jgi:hypothetical protein
MANPAWDYLGSILAALGNIAQILQLFVPQRTAREEADVTAAGSSSPKGIFVTRKRLVMTLVLTIISGGLAVYGLIRNGSTGPPEETIIANLQSGHWGISVDPLSHNPKSVYVDVQINSIGPKAKDYNLVAITRAAFDQVDGFTDNTIDRSSAFAIVPGSRRIEIPLSQASIERFNAGHVIDLWAVALPVEFDPKQIMSLASMQKLGVIRFFQLAVGGQVK